MMKKIILLTCFTIITNIVVGQSVKRYEGMMRLPSDLEQLKDVVKIYGIGDGGQGYYDYYEDSEENRVKHGKFYLKVNGYDINGAYLHGKKVGQWTIAHPVENGYIKSYYNNLKITYKDDAFCGPCEYITRSQGWPATITITCNFNNGILTGNASFFAQYDSYSITSECQGNIDKDGLLQGIWIISDKGGIEIKQKRSYYKGALIFVEEQDYSTGEKTICYSAFENSKKIPDLEKIKDTIINEHDGIVYDGQIAIKTRSFDFPSKAKSSAFSIINSFPNSMTDSPSLLGQQGENWKYAYSQNAYEKMIESQRTMRQRQAEERIKNEQRARENEIETAYLAFLDYIAEIRNNYIKIIENYNGSYTTAYMTTCNTNGTIRKCNNENGITTFKIGKETVSDVFSKDYVKTEAGEVFSPQPPIELLSNEDGSMLIYQYGSYRNKCVLLIIKKGQNKGVYTLSSSAQKCW